MSPGGECAADFDADLLVIVTGLDLNLPSCMNGLLASAGFLVIDQPGTNRPIAGEVQFCGVNPADFTFDLTVTVHEMMHVLVCPAPCMPCTALYPL